jgi:hypothetical protein
MRFSVKVIKVVQADILALRRPLFLAVAVGITQGVIGCGDFADIFGWFFTVGSALIGRNDVAVLIDSLYDMLVRVATSTVCT